MKNFKAYITELKKAKEEEELAKKHKVSVKSIEKAVRKGVKIEKEHTTSAETAEKIAKHHIDELPDYYDRLEKMEKK